LQKTILGLVFGLIGFVFAVIIQPTVMGLQQIWFNNHRNIGKPTTSQQEEEEEEEEEEEVLLVDGFCY